MNLKEKQRTENIIEQLDNEIEFLISTGTSDPKVLAQIETLTQTRSNYISDREDTSIDKGVLVSAGISISSLLMILHYEKIDIITSKGFSLFQKMLK